ncbi:uncharacterized protein LOC129963911 [Argiope bruennichi]|uniref:Uncharacterized protein n=1 Tax=Argiope bruennichi TaxID=94029 RepID=A0A8T0EYF6_ARGBR|nr:uncharacterized protein LOC129963911 [Argiope bruennichi]KAF8782627.1 hypothetical protein HNY73_012891 [Argiope bruennichi]
MAGRGDHIEGNELCDNLNRLRYEVGSLRLLMRNNNDCVMSELLLAPSTGAESKDAEILHPLSESDKIQSLEQVRLEHSLSDRILTDIINQCKDPLEQTCLRSEYLKKLSEIEADLKKKVDELSHKYEESFSQIIHSS